ncbi:MAG TPA: enoyl-CoA hydratase-related protein, partial [Spirochaetota bacterium]|nr:enoyl-CoA hydratase-related protein [Spirochaetota bacterium]
MIKERNEDNIIIATFENGKYNTITTETLLQIRDLVKRVTEDDALKGIVFTGNGRTYCSGFDLPTFLGFFRHHSTVPAAW